MMFFLLLVTQTPAPAVLSGHLKIEVPRILLISLIRFCFIASLCWTFSLEAKLKKHTSNLIIPPPPLKPPIQHYGLVLAPCRCCRSNHSRQTFCVFLYSDALIMYIPLVCHGTPFDCLKEQSCMGLLTHQATMPLVRILLYACVKMCRGCKPCHMVNINWERWIHNESKAFLYFWIL